MESLNNEKNAGNFLSLETEEFLTVDELAVTLKVSKTKIYSMTREKGPESIPRYKIGKYIRFVPKEVLEWLKEYKRI